MRSITHRVIPLLISFLASVFLYSRLSVQAFAQVASHPDACLFSSCGSDMPVMRADTAMHTKLTKPASNEDSKEKEVKKPLFVAVKSAFASNVQPQLGTNGLKADVLFDMVNSHRASVGLPAFQKDARTCSLASERASELSGEFASYTLHSGLYRRDLPYRITENAIHIRSEEQALNWWLRSSIHRSQLLGNHIYSCLACVGNSCSQLFTSFLTK